VGPRRRAAAAGVTGEDRDPNAVARNRPGGEQPIWTEPSPRRVRAFLDAVAVVDSTRALLLLEVGHLPVYYFPPQDVRTDLLEPTDTSTRCPLKGDASSWCVLSSSRHVRVAVAGRTLAKSRRPWLLFETPSAPRSRTWSASTTSEPTSGSTASSSPGPTRPVRGGRRGRASRQRQVSQTTPLGR
jgi:uncharacterized protein (DUF427 family)